MNENDTLTTDGNPTLDTPKSEVKNTSTSENMSRLKAASVTMMILAGALAIYGLSKIYDNSYDSRIVGGDAYNFIIYATRGTAWVCSGIVSAIIGLTFAVFDSSRKNNN